MCRSSSYTPRLYSSSALYLSRLLPPQTALASAPSDLGSQRDNHGFLGPGPTLLELPNLNKGQSRFVLGLTHLQLSPFIYCAAQVCEPFMSRLSPSCPSDGQCSPDQPLSGCRPALQEHILSHQIHCFKDGKNIVHQVVAGILELAGHHPIQSNTYLLCPCFVPRTM